MLEEALSKIKKGGTERKPLEQTFIAYLTCPRDTATKILERHKYKGEANQVSG